jgi:hypothetical protein
MVPMKNRRESRSAGSLQAARPALTEQQTRRTNTKNV